MSGRRQKHDKETVDETRKEKSCLALEDNHVKTKAFAVLP